MPPIPSIYHEKVYRFWLPFSGSFLACMTMSPSTTTSMKALERFIKKPSAQTIHGLSNLTIAMVQEVENYKRPMITM